MTETPKKVETPLLEWIAAAIGLALLLFLMGVIAREAIRTGTTETPAVTVVALGTSASASGHVVTFEARNAHNGTAAAVEIEGVLSWGHGQQETSSATIDYVPGRGKAEGGLFFRHDPARGRLELRPLGYQKP